jgi:hypothetical protein
MILRPLADDNGTKTIAGGQSIYGSGPENLEASALTDAFDKATGYHIPVEYALLCAYGKQGYALTRNISSDVDRAAGVGGGSCEQTQEQYDEAYQNLVDAGWPPPQLEVPAYREVAEAHVGKLALIGARGVDIGELGVRLAVMLADACIADDNMIRLVELVNDDGALYRQMQLVLTHKLNIHLEDDDNFDELHQEVQEELAAIMCNRVPQLSRTHILLLEKLPAEYPEWKPLDERTRGWNVNRFYRTKEARDVKDAGDQQFPEYDILQAVKEFVAFRKTPLQWATYDALLLEEDPETGEKRVLVEEDPETGEMWNTGGRYFLAFSSIWEPYLKGLIKRAVLDVVLPAGEFDWCPY